MSAANTSVEQEGTHSRILRAARACLLADGYASFSTRKVAGEAQVPLSQIHYHFGSKEELILSLLRHENNRLLERQTFMYASDRPLWQRWQAACDFFDEDLESGYVRVLQEMTAAGWSSEPIAAEMRAIHQAWANLLASVISEAASRQFRLGVFSAGELASLVSAAFLGAESQILLGTESDAYPIRPALRKVGELIRLLEEGGV